MRYYNERERAYLNLFQSSFFYFNELINKCVNTLKKISHVIFDLKKSNFCIVLDTTKNICTMFKNLQDNLFLI